MSKTSKAQCPAGHTKDLVIRRICDFPVTGVDDGIVEFDESKAPVDIDHEADMLGTSSGVWCPSCEEWYQEEEITPVDDKK